jgi:hypothetical protein
MSLLQVGQCATDLFDAAAASDWDRAAEDLQSLNEAALEVPDDLPRLDLVAKLQSNVADVTDATNTKQRIETMDAANAITQVVAGLSAQYEPVVPYNVKMLGYYGRQIELGLASGRPADSRQAVSDLATAWNRIEPAIARRGHADDARHFSDLVVNLTGAERPSDVLAAAGAERVAAARIERLFTSPE